MKKYLPALLGIISAIYLLNPGAGLFDIIPDVIPFVGNLDEATAAAIVIAALKFYGIDINEMLFKKVDKK